MQRVIGELKQRYPEVSVGEGRGARSEFSTYLHLAVCWLERDAMIRLVGQEQALIKGGVVICGLPLGEGET